MPLVIERLRDHLRAASARWTVGTNVFTPMADAERRRHLSYQPSHDELSLKRRDAIARLTRLHRDTLPPLGSAIDLRTRNGTSFVSAVGERALGGCTKIVMTVIESTLRTTHENPSLSLVAPTAEIVVTSAGRQWLAEKYRELALPIRDAERHVSIRRWHELHTRSAMKQWLTTHGPLLAVVTVHEDFFAYASGVYHQISGALDGGHCVAVIGYDDDGQYWIAQNTWGGSWGERGCFRIAFGERGIDASMWGVELHEIRGR